MSNLLYTHTPLLTAEFRNVYQALAGLRSPQAPDPGVEPGVQEELGVAQFSYAVNIVTRLSENPHHTTKLIIAVTSGSFAMQDLWIAILLRDPLDAITHVNFSVHTTADRTHADVETNGVQVLTGGVMLAQWDWTSSTAVKRPVFYDPINVADNDTLQLWITSVVGENVPGSSYFRYKALLCGTYVPTDGPQFPVGATV